MGVGQCSDQPAKRIIGFWASLKKDGLTVGNKRVGRFTRSSFYCPKPLGDTALQGIDGSDMFVKQRNNIFEYI